MTGRSGQGIVDAPQEPNDEANRQQTSTPKKKDLDELLPLVMMNMDKDDDDDNSGDDDDMDDDVDSLGGGGGGGGVGGLDEHNGMLQTSHGNESFGYLATANHSIIDSTSSSTSERSFMHEKQRVHFPRKVRTEPPRLKLAAAHNASNIQAAAAQHRTDTSPCKTPPWKPMTTSFAAGYGAHDLSTPIGPTRQKLLFDDKKDKENVCAGVDVK